jgi:hypothetical protein
VGLWNKSSVVESAQYHFFADQKEMLEATDLTDKQYQKSLSFSSRIPTESILYRSKILHKLRAPRKISAFQCFCGHEKAANRAA